MGGHALVFEEAAMAENYEVVYTHPSGATATFIRHEGELDALAKALDSEQQREVGRRQDPGRRHCRGECDEPCVQPRPRPSR